MDDCLVRVGNIKAILVEHRRTLMAERDAANTQESDSIEILLGTPRVKGKRGVVAWTLTRNSKARSETALELHH